MSHWTEEPIEALLGRSIECGCGAVHATQTRRVLLGSGVNRYVGYMAREAGMTNVLLLADENTYKVAGEAVVQSLEGYSVAHTNVILKAGAHCDAHSIGRAMIDMSFELDGIIAIGSGSINDTARMLARSTRRHYIIVATAPSMDGYASTVAPVIRDGIKVTLPAVAPFGIIGELDVLKNAPQRMLAAGLGDMIAKFEALFEWRMSSMLTGETYCEDIAGLMLRAANRAMESAHGLAARDDGAVMTLMEGLVLSGLAMQLNGSSRPASGAEHHISHFLEVKDVKLGRGDTLHGDKVGVASLYMMKYIGKFFSSRPTGTCPPTGMDSANIGRVFGEQAEAILRDIPQEPPINWLFEREQFLYQFDFQRDDALALAARHDEARAAIAIAGGPTTPEELGYTRAEFREAMRYAMYMREYLSVLRLGYRFELLDVIINEILE